MTDSSSKTDNNTIITPETKFDNFFALFEHPITFHIAQDALDQRLRVLQRRYHPDNVAKGVNIQQQPEQASALINQAYQTLSAPDSRASYLLDMQGQTITVEQSIADLEFLDDAMDMRIHLDEATQSSDQGTLQELHPKIACRIQAQSDTFSKAYDQQDWLTAIDATQKLKFLVKLEADVKSGLDKVASSAQSDDDDLYV